MFVICLATTKVISFSKQGTEKGLNKVWLHSGFNPWPIEWVPQHLAHATISTLYSTSGLMHKMIKTWATQQDIRLLKLKGWQHYTMTLHASTHKQPTCNSIILLLHQPTEYRLVFLCLIFCSKSDNTICTNSCHQNMTCKLKGKKLTFSHLSHYS